MNIEKLKQIITEIVNQYGYKIYSIKFKQEFGAQILEVLLDETNLSHDLIEPLHEKIANAIDEDLPESAFLEVSSVGLERPLNTLEEIKDHIEGYVYVVSDYYKGHGTILNVTEETVLIEVNDKSKKIKKEIPYTKISQIRKAIKF
ncbi:MAG: hypothetical protein GX312_01285 [Candidatus Phytoplasma sp.]|nr:hypothetical protein [Phytoplasma sp.]